MKPTLHLSLLAALALAGCSTYDYVPPTGYDANSTPNSATAIVTTNAIFHAAAITRVAHVDGKSPCSGTLPCPPAVRLLPGSHTFAVEIKALAGPITEGTAEVSIADVKARHIYEVMVSIAPNSKSAKASVHDLGEDPRIVQVEVSELGKYLLEGSPIEPEMLLDALRGRCGADQRMLVHVAPSPKAPGPIALRAFEAVPKAGCKSTFVPSNAFQ